MSLYKEWDKLTTNQTEESFGKFWEEYCDAEIKLYTSILKENSEKFSFTVSEIAETFEISNVLVVGFVDGIKSSLNNENEVNAEILDDTTKINLDINFEKLYYNMLVVDAKHLYSLEAWNNVLSNEKREEISKAHKKSKTIIKTKTPGRNEPCSCGSTKKYKHCCGK